MQTPDRMLFADFVVTMKANCEEKHKHRTRYRIAAVSVHDERFGEHCAGQGMVWNVPIPYCPECENVPSDRGCVHVPYDLLEQDFPLQTPGMLRHDRRVTDLPRNIVLRMTSQEHSALIGIMVEYIRLPGATQEWIDIVTDRKLSLSQLMALITLPEFES